MSEHDLSSTAWEAFHKLNVTEKAPYFDHDGRPYDVMVAQQFDRGRLETLGSLATAIRRIAKTEEGMGFLSSQLSHKRAMLYFTQPSSRTFLSFTAACQILGMPVAEVRDTATSSEVKGESKEDSVRTFSSYYDMLIMREKDGGLAERMAWVFAHSERPVPIINAGSGKDQHPTQALLDIYTLQRSFESRGGIDGKTIVFVGDLLRGRTVRSLAWLLTNYRGIRLRFVAPASLQIAPDILALLQQAGVDYDVSEDFERALPGADAVYMTRIQDEWDQPGQKARVDVDLYSLRVEHLARLKADAVLMHPFPRRLEIEVAVDRDPRAMYWRQMRNGMWIRAALIAWIFNKDGNIRGYVHG
ncbi:MAG: aspartate carbamoyltransferase [Kiritimatiellia bacterium]